MLIIDRFAYTNKFCNLNPYLKVIISMLLILLSIISSNIYFLSSMIVSIILTIFEPTFPKIICQDDCGSGGLFVNKHFYCYFYFWFFLDNVYFDGFVYLKQFQIINFYIDYGGLCKNGLTLGLKALAA